MYLSKIKFFRFEIFVKLRFYLDGLLLVMLPHIFVTFIHYALYEVRLLGLQTDFHYY